MSVVVTVISAVLVFGFLIFIHEFGHYITARLFHVTIEEFSIGMGPRLFWYDSKKTGIRYTVSALPIGGFVSMPGEDGESDEYAADPNTFDKKPAWQRLIIISAGALVNIIMGMIAMIVLVSLIRIGNNTISKFEEPEIPGTEVISSEDSGLMVGDEVIAVDGKRVYIPDELAYEIMRRGNEPIDITVIRDGEEITIPDVIFPSAEAEGQTFGSMDFYVTAEEKTFGRVISYSFRKCTLTLRMCWESIYDLIRGRYTIAAVSGPVGISTAIGEATSQGFTSLLSIVAIISINLGFMNLLPLPALDGGRLLLILIELVTRKKLPTKVESMINAIGLFVLLGFSLFIMVKDVFSLIN